MTGGFLIGLDLSFHAGLNAVIGPRGTGKSSIQELIRYALKALPGREGDPLRKRVETLIENNLNGGRVELEIETKDGLVYIISRAAGEDPVLMDEKRRPLAVDPAAAQLFRADIYSQNQIESIAETPHYQLDLLDKFEDEALRAVRGQVDETLRHLDANAAQMLPLITEKAAIEDELAQIDVIQEKLKGLVQHAGQRSEELEHAHVQKSLRDREMRALEEAEETLAEYSGNIRLLIGACDVDSKTLFRGDLRTAPNKAILTEIFAELKTGVKSAESALKKAADTVKHIGEGVKEAKRNLHARHVEQDIEFRGLVEKHQQDQSEAAERTKLERQFNDLLFKKNRLVDVEADIAKLSEQRIQLLDRLMADRQKRFGIRDGVANTLNKHLMPQIRVSFQQFTDTDALRKWLESSMRRSGIHTNVVAAQLSEALAPRQLAGLVRKGDARALSIESGINFQQATTVIRALSPPEKAMELEVIDMDDTPRIELNDNGNYKNSESLSTGQKCTAILPILLFESANPLLIDQPEDNLDNSYVYNSVVASITQAKGTRQMIFVTHNPNIPVLGNADLVVVMESDGRTAKPKKEGSVDDCQTDIINLLEGGAEAFRLRSERYQGNLK